MDFPIRPDAIAAFDTASIEALAQGGRQLDLVARADPDARLAGEIRIGRNHATVRCERRGWKADRFQRGTWISPGPARASQQRGAGEMRPQAVELLCDRAGHRPLAWAFSIENTRVSPARPRPHFERPSQDHGAAAVRCKNPRH
jgi:hypothetical protein